MHKKDDIDFILIDTPGQIEVFTWSASGTIISDSIARSFPTVIAYVMDTVRQGFSEFILNVFIIQYFDLSYNVLKVIFHILV